MIKNCAHCHRCARPIRSVLDGEEWCATCQNYQRPRSHGWRTPDSEPTPCPTTFAEYCTGHPTEPAYG